MIKDLETAKNIYDQLQSAKTILLVTHQNPDGDGLGAASAMALWLKSLNKDYNLFCRTEVPASSYFLPLIHQVSTEEGDFYKQPYDLIVVLDSGSLEHAGIHDLIGKIDYDYTLINIDHHLSNNNFGDLNLVQVYSSSASEIIYDLFRYWQVKITKEIATALLNGIIFDTSLFSNDATTLSSLNAASYLLNTGARHQEINQSILRNKSLNLLKLWGKAFERLAYNPKYNLAYTIVTRQDFEECQLEPNALEGLSNFFNELSGANAVMVLMEKDDEWIKGSFRTTHSKINVAALAKEMNGGGHRKAAGFSVKGKLVYNEGRWEVN